MESQMERSLRSSFSLTQWQEGAVDGDRPNDPPSGAKALISQLVGNSPGDKTGPNEQIERVSWAWGSAEFGHDKTEAKEKGKSHGATGRMWKPGHLARKVR
jgi:hypothetical protein